MKKKLIPFIATIACGAACACALVACGEDPGEEKGVDVTVSVSLTYVGENSYASVSPMFLDFPEEYPTPTLSRSDENNVHTFTGSITSKKKKDPVLWVGCYDGYDISTVVITEKNDRQFTTRVDETSNIMYITMPFGTTISYEFEASEPSARKANVKIGAPDNGELNQSQNAVLKDIVQNAKLYVADGAGNKSFAPFAVYDSGKDENVFNLDGRHVVADMSASTFAVYAYFDASNHERVIYDSYAGIFGLKKSNGNIVTADSVRYVKVPGTETYAYRYLFLATDLNNDQGQLAANDCAIVLNTAGISNEFIKSRINKSVSTRPYEGYGETHYDFELVEYKVDGGDWTAAGEGYLDKEYGKAYTLKYKFTDYEVITGGEKDEQETAELLAATDFSALKLSVNGKTLPANKCVYEKVEDEHFYTVTLGREDIPVDYGATDTFAGKYFKVDMALDSLKVVDSVKSLTVTNGEGLEGGAGWVKLLSKYKTADGKQISKYTVGNGGGFEVYGDLSVSQQIKQCKIKITVDGTEYTSRLYKFGEDYNPIIAENTGDYAAFGDANVIVIPNMIENNYDYLFGHETDPKYIAVYSNSTKVGYRIVDKNTGSHTDVKVELVEVEYMTVNVEIGETDEPVEIKYLKIGDQEMTEQGIALTASNYTYSMFMQVVPTADIGEDSIGYTAEYYSNGVKIAAGSVGFSDRTVGDWETDAGNSSISLGSSSGSGTSGGYMDYTIEFYCSNPVIRFYKTNDDGSMDSESVLYVLIDKVVIIPVVEKLNN